MVERHINQSEASKSSLMLSCLVEKKCCYQERVLNINCLTQCPEKQGTMSKNHILVRIARREGTKSSIQKRNTKSGCDKVILAA